MTSHKQTTDGNQYTTGYTYNLSGAMIEQTYPSGRVVKNTLDVDGSLSQVQSAKSGQTLKNFANGFNYNAAGAVTSMRLGNGLWETTVFNSRMQPTQIGLGNGSATPNKLKLDYSYGTTANNGNVLSQTITAPGVTHPFVQNYTYDELNRLKSATETQNSEQAWKQEFTFDRFGNRNFDEANSTTLPKDCNNNTEVCAAIRPVVNPSVNTANNRLNGYTFDTAGNTTLDAEGRTFIYDAENKQVEAKDSLNATIGQYVYDGDGKRVKKVVPGGETTVFVYDAGGKLIGEYSSVVQTGSDAKTVYTTNDHLGSPRINTDATGQVISRHDYHPFGEEIARTGYGSDTIRKQFTGYERDGETGLDFAQARMYSQVHGRFTVSDPLDASMSADNPQTFNRYIYALNRPTVLIDPSGMVPGDYYDRDGSYIGSDGLRDDKLWLGDRANARIVKGKVVSATGFTEFDTKHSQFQRSAHIVKAEAQSSDYDEYRFIAHTGNNEAKATNTYLHDALATQSTAPKGSLSTADNGTAAKFARQAVFDVLLGNPDPTDGARRWDGIDFLVWGLNSAPRGTPAHNKFEEYSELRIPLNILNAYISSVSSKYPRGVSYYGRPRIPVPEAVFNQHRSLFVWRYKTGVPNSSPLTATATKGYSIFWALR